MRRRRKKRNKSQIRNKRGRKGSRRKRKKGSGGTVCGSEKPSFGSFLRMVLIFSEFISFSSHIRFIFGTLMSGVRRFRKWKMKKRNPWETGCSLTKEWNCSIPPHPFSHPLSPRGFHFPPHIPRETKGWLTRREKTRGKEQKTTPSQKERESCCFPNG